MVRRVGLATCRRRRVDDDVREGSGLGEVRIDALEQAADDYDGRMDIVESLIDRIEETVSRLEAGHLEAGPGGRAGRGVRPASPAAR